MIGPVVLEICPIKQWPRNWHFMTINRRETPVGVIHPRQSSERSGMNPDIVVCSIKMPFYAFVYASVLFFSELISLAIIWRIVRRAILVLCSRCRINTLPTVAAQPRSATAMRTCHRHCN